MSRMRMKSSGKKRPGIRTTSSRVRSRRFGKSTSSKSLGTQTKAKMTMVRMLLVPFLLLLVLLLGMWVFRTFDPFYSFNPFLKEITIGQTVIGSWHYGGLDGTGNLRFYHDTNGFQTVMLPANSSRFAADGQFVILLNHSPISLIFETRGQYMLQMLFQTFTILTIMAVTLLVFAQFALRKSKRNAFRASKLKR